jgi:hypothetical protein
LDGASHAKASLRVHVMIWVHEIRSSSTESLAGPRMANIAAKHSPAAQVIAGPHA